MNIIEEQISYSTALCKVPLKCSRNWIQVPLCKVLVLRLSTVNIHSGRPITSLTSSMNWALERKAEVITCMIHVILGTYALLQAIYCVPGNPVKEHTQRHGIINGSYITDDMIETQLNKRYLTGFKI